MLEFEPEILELLLFADNHFPKVMELLPSFWVSFDEFLPVLRGDILGNLLGFGFDGRWI